jgi:hypothetical protein
VRSKSPYSKKFAPLNRSGRLTPSRRDRTGGESDERINDAPGVMPMAKLDVLFVGLIVSVLIFEALHLNVNTP